MNNKSSGFGVRRLKKAKGDMSMGKHRKSGYAPGPEHFTGRKAGKKIAEEIMHTKT